MALFFLAFGEKLSTRFLLLTVATMLNTAQAKISRDPCANTDLCHSAVVIEENVTQPRKRVGLQDGRETLKLYGLEM